MLSAAPAEDFCLNLMWLNRIFNESQEYIANNEAFFDIIYKWAGQLEGQGQILVWYDSTTTSEKAIANTQHKISGFLQNKSLASDYIKLCNIMEL